MSLDVIAFACTSASMVIGPEKITNICKKAKPGLRGTTNPLTAGIAALKHLQAQKIALVTPYRDDLNQNLAKCFAQEGIFVETMASFNVEDDNVVGRISPQSIAQLVLDVGADPNIEAVFVSCTNMRIVEKIPELELKLGKPVTSSNHAMAWHSLALLDIKLPFVNQGKLFELNI